MKKCMEEELFLNSWISFFRTTSNLGNEVLVEVIEHKPVASLDNNRYLTQGGGIIEPEKENMIGIIFGRVCQYAKSYILNC